MSRAFNKDIKETCKRKPYKLNLGLVRNLTIALN